MTPTKETKHENSMKRKRKLNIYNKKKTKTKQNTKKGTTQGKGDGK